MKGLSCFARERSIFTTTFVNDRKKRIFMKVVHGIKPWGPLGKRTRIESKTNPTVEWQVRRKQCRTYVEHTTPQKNKLDIQWGVTSQATIVQRQPENFIHTNSTEV